MEYEYCVRCDNDLWHSDSNDYVGICLKGEAGFVCKECEETDTDLVMVDVRPPTHLTFIVYAHPWTRAKVSRTLTTDWKKVVDLVGIEPNKYSIGIIDEDLTCRGDYIRKALLRGEPSKEEDFLNDDGFLQAAYDSEAFDLVIYASKADREGRRLKWAKGNIPSFEEYVDAICETPTESTVFIGTHNDGGVVPNVSARFLYYRPNDAVHWYPSLWEAEKRWKSLDMIKPYQYKLQIKKLKV